MATKTTAINIYGFEQIRPCDWRTQELNERKQLGAVLPGEMFGLMGDAFLKIRSLFDAFVPTVEK